MRYAYALGMTRQTLTDEAATALALTPTAALLRAAYALTHRIHEAEHKPADHDVLVFLAIRDELANLRAQRDLIDAEVLRRTGGL